MKTQLNNLMYESTEVCRVINEGEAILQLNLFGDCRRKALIGCSTKPATNDQLCLIFVTRSHSENRILHIQALAKASCMAALVPHEH